MSNDDIYIMKSDTDTTIQLSLPLTKHRGLCLLPTYCQSGDEERRMVAWRLNYKDSLKTEVFTVMWAKTI